MKKIYFPTNWGDVSIVEEEGKTVVETTELTPLEELQVTELLKQYGEVIPEKLENQRIKIDEPLSDIHKSLKKILKKGKPTLTAIKLKDGSMELVEEIDKKEFEKAITVEKPKSGCELPTITERKEEHASMVLSEFLTPNQLADYKKEGMFMAKGNYTDLPYLITSRWNPQVTKFGKLYDIVHERSICENCEGIPPSEEMLCLKLSVELNEREFIFGVGEHDTTMLHFR